MGIGKRAQGSVAGHVGAGLSRQNLIANKYIIPQSRQPLQEFYAVMNTGGINPPLRYFEHWRDTRPYVTLNP